MLVSPLSHVVLHVALDSIRICSLLASLPEQHEYIVYASCVYR